LHDETFQFNSIINFGINVKSYFDRNGITRPECVVMTPGDSWDEVSGFSINSTDWYTAFQQRLDNYRESKQGALTAIIKKEAAARLDEEAMAVYIKQLAKAMPWILRRMMKGKNITFVCCSGSETEYFDVDIYRKICRRIDHVTDEANPRQIWTSSHLIQQCIENRMWSSLWISKRIRYRVCSDDIKFIQLFQHLLAFMDFEFVP